MANYYLLEKYGPAFVTPIAESVLLIFNAIFSVCLLGEKMTIDMLVGLGFILLGIFFIFHQPNLQNPSLLLGNQCFFLVW